MILDLFNKRGKRFKFKTFKIFLLATIRSWDYPENFGICSQLNRKSKTCFFTFLNVNVFWIERNKVLIPQLSPPKFRFLETKMDQRGVPMKMNFENFQIQKWISQTVRAQKVDEKNGVICLVYLFPSWVVILTLTEIVSLLQFCTDVSKKSKFVIANCVYASESSRFAFLENGIKYIIRLWVWKILGSAIDGFC